MSLSVQMYPSAPPRAASWQPMLPVAADEAVNNFNLLTLAASEAVSEWVSRRERLGDAQDALQARLAAMLEALEFDLLLVGPSPEEAAALAMHQEMKRKAETLARGRMLSAVNAVVSSPEGARAFNALASPGEFDHFPGLIEAAEGNLLDPIEHVLAEYMKQLEALMAVMADLSKYISADSDNVTISGAFAAALAAALKDFGPLISFATRDEAQAFVDKLGLPNLQVTGSATTGFAVSVDTSALKSILEKFPKSGSGDLVLYSPLVLSNAAFQAWVNGKDATVEAFQHIAQVLAQDLSRKNQLFTDITGALSKAMDRLLQMMMGFVNGIST